MNIKTISLKDFVRQLLFLGKCFKENLPGYMLNVKYKKNHASYSVSGDPAHRPDVFRMSEFLIEELKALGATVETRDLGKQEWCGQQLDLPPIVLASVGTDPEKKTILVYGHYDVQPVSYFFEIHTHV